MHFRQFGFYANPNYFCNHYLSDQNLRFLSSKENFNILLPPFYNSKVTQGHAFGRCLNWILFSYPPRKNSLSSPSYMKPKWIFQVVLYIFPIPIEFFIVGEGRPPPLFSPGGEGPVAGC